MAGSRKRAAGDGPHGDLAGAVASALGGHARRGDHVTVGLSGGVDSVVLLDALRTVAPTLGVSLSALHVNHGLSPNAAHWAVFCARHCARRGVPFEQVSVVVGAGGNVEARARDARYRAFASRARGWLALAHHRDDQAETVLLRLVRGAGVHGLAGMPAARRVAAHPGAAEHDGESRIIRPLLEVGRDAILAHARRRRLRWVEDESNADSRFARNFIRKSILPMLERTFPGCRESIARAALHLREADALLREIAATDLALATTEQGIDVAALAALGDARAAQALRLALERCGEPSPATRTMHEIVRQFAASGAEAHPCVVLSRVELRRHRGRLVIRPVQRSGAPWQSVPWGGEAIQRLPDDSLIRAQPVLGEGVALAALTGASLTLRRRRGGERVRLRADGPARTLKNLLQEHAVPSWERQAMPLLYCNEQLVWVPEVGVAAGFRARPGEAGLLFAWERRTTDSTE